MSKSYPQAYFPRARQIVFGLIIAFLLTVLCQGLPAFAGRGKGQLGFDFDWKPCPTKRVIVFPRDYSLGELIIGPDPSASEEESLNGAARGTIVVPAGKFVTFIPAAGFYKDPSIINTLPPDGIDSIGIFFSSLADAEDGICDKSLSLVGHLKGVIKLRLDRCDATDKGVAFAKDLPNLQMISGFQTSFEGKSLKALAGHKQLKCINLPSSGMRDENVQYLAAIPHLQFLNLCHCHLSDAGIKNLAGCNELQYLDISDNPGITDQSIKTLLTLKSLRALTLSNTAMSNMGTKQFKPLKLRRLTLPGSVYKLTELKELRQAMPDTMVVARGQPGKKVDAETNKLFEPLH